MENTHDTTRYLRKDSQLISWPKWYSNGIIYCVYNSHHKYIDSCWIDHIFFIILIPCVIGRHKPKANLRACCLICTDDVYPRNWHCHIWELKRHKINYLLLCITCDICQAPTNLYSTKLRLKYNPEKIITHGCKLHMEVWSPFVNDLSLFLERILKWNTSSIVV